MGKRRTMQLNRELWLKVIQERFAQMNDFFAAIGQTRQNFYRVFSANNVTLSTLIYWIEILEATSPIDDATFRAMITGIEKTEILQSEYDEEW